MGKAKRSRTKKIIEAKSITVKVDPKLKALWDPHMHTLEAAKSSDAKAFDVLWETVDAIVNHDPPLYVLGNYASAAEFISKELHETMRTAQRNMRVARFADATQEERYGVATLDAVIGFLETKAGAPLHGRAPIDFDRVKIPVRDGKTTHMRSLADVTVKDIARATATLMGVAKKRPTSDAYRAIATQLSAQAPLTEVEIHEHAGLFSFRNVPAGALQHFGNAVIRGAGKVGKP